MKKLELKIGADGIIESFLEGERVSITLPSKIIRGNITETEEVNFYGYNKRILESEDIFIEKLFVWEVWID